MDITKSPASFRNMDVVNTKGKLGNWGSVPVVNTIELPMTADKLQKLNVVPHVTCLLSLKPDYMERAASTRQIGGDDLWSSSRFRQHLQMLADLIPHHPNDPSSWVSGLFRVSAMVGSDKHMVFDIGPVPPTIAHSSKSSTFLGIINYTVVIASEATAQRFLSQPTLENIRVAMPNAFFIAEAKMKFGTLLDHIPQAISEMYACLKSLQKKALRGALTNGNDWIFLIVELNPNSDGATYQYSPPIEQCSKGKIGDIWPELVAGILHDWVENSFTSIEGGDNDWFETHLP